jgi:hypothetical protein
MPRLKIRGDVEPGGCRARLMSSGIDRVLDPCARARRRGCRRRRLPACPRRCGPEHGVDRSSVSITDGPRPAGTSHVPAGPIGLRRVLRSVHVQAAACPVLHGRPFIPGPGCHPPHPARGRSTPGWSGPAGRRRCDHGQSDPHRTGPDRRAMPLCPAGPAERALKARATSSVMAVIANPASSRTVLEDNPRDALNTSRVHAQSTSRQCLAGALR